MTDSELNARREVIKILDDVLTEGIWTGSLFLEAAGKKISELRARLIEQFQLDNHTRAPSVSEHSHIAPVANDKIPVYVAVYQTTGLNIQKWEMLLHSLSNFISGRPIYKNEEDVKAFIRSKENQQNDAYFVAYVALKDILNPPLNKSLADRAGRELLMLKEGAIKAENIVRFIHVTGEYQFKQGVLVKNLN